MAVPNAPSSIPGETSCKNRLQEFVQRASMPLPVYKTLQEGVAHAPRFRCEVLVDGECYTTPDMFTNRKTAEQNAAKHALIGIREKIKNEGRSRIFEDINFCKSIIHEYVLKMNMNAPTYETTESKALLPVFVSSLILDGAKFVGDAARNKKEAEQLAARSAILSILDSEQGTTMSETVKSKFKFYDVLKKFNESSNVQGVVVADGAAQLEDSVAQVAGIDNTGSCAAVQQCTRAQTPVQLGLLQSTSQQVPDGAAQLEDSVAQVVGAVNTCTCDPQSSYAQIPVQPGLPHSTSQQPSITHEANQSLHAVKLELQNPAAQVGTAYTCTSAVAVPQSTYAQMPIQLEAPKSTSEQLGVTHDTHHSLHQFKKPRLENSLPEIAPPIEFVPPASQQPPVSSTSAKKRRNKKAKKKMEAQSLSAVNALPDNNVRAC